MIRTRLPNLSGKSDSEVIKELIRCVNNLIEELNQTDGKEDIRLPIGTEIMRYREVKNAGMDYGRWIPSDRVQTANRELMVYVRTE